jgi:hypothetical protein
MPTCPPADCTRGQAHELSFAPSRVRRGASHATGSFKPRHPGRVREQDGRRFRGSLSRPARGAGLAPQKWNEHKELFEKGEARIEVLNKSASNFFYFLNKLLFEDAMLHLCRLTDPPQTKGHSNLTIMRLAEAIGHPELSANVRSASEQARDRCEFARKWRDKYLAHADLWTFQNKGASPLPEVLSRDIEEALSAADQALWSVEQYYGLPPTIVSHDPWGASSLVHCLGRAAQAQEEEDRQRWHKLAQGDG